MTQPVMMFNGALNMPDIWLGLPLYYWGWLLQWIIIGITWFVLKKLWWDPYVKFHGLHFAKKNDSGCSLIIDATGDTEMVAEQIAKCIFNYGEDDYEIEIPELPLQAIKIASVIVSVGGLYVLFAVNWLAGLLLLALAGTGYFIDRIVPWVYANAFYYPTKYLPGLDWKTALKYKVGKVNFDCKIAQKLQNGEWDQYPAIVAAGILVDIVLDTDHWAERKSKQHKAIVKSARTWNKDHPWSKDNTGDEVHTYTKWLRHVRAGKIDKPDEVTISFNVQWNRIDKGYPFDLKSSDTAGKRRQMAIDKNIKLASSEYTRYAIYMIVGVTIFGVIGIILKTMYHAATTARPAAVAVVTAVATIVPK